MSAGCGSLGRPRLGHGRHRAGREPASARGRADPGRQGASGRPSPPAGLPGRLLRPQGAGSGPNGPAGRPLRRRRGWRPLDAGGRLGPSFLQVVICWIWACWSASICRASRRTSGTLPSRSSAAVARRHHLRGTAGRTWWHEPATTARARMRTAYHAPPPWTPRPSCAPWPGARQDPSRSRGQPARGAGRNPDAAAG